MSREKIEKIQDALNLLEEESNTNYENFLIKIGYLNALKDYKIITTKEAFEILKNL